VQPVRQDQREFTEFYAAAWDDCLRIVALSVGNRQLAEDLVAEAFTKAWTSWRKIRGLDQPRAWVIRAGMTACGSSRSAWATGSLPRTWWRRLSRRRGHHGGRYAGLTSRGRGSSELG